VQHLATGITFGQRAQSLYTLKLTQADEKVSSTAALEGRSILVSPNPNVQSHRLVSQ
jgi:hypothetical protein